MRLKQYISWFNPPETFNLITILYFIAIYGLDNFHYLCIPTELSHMQHILITITSLIGNH